MKRHVIRSLLLVPATLGVALAQEGQNPRDVAWQAFSRDHGSWQSSWSKATQTPAAVFGPGLQLQAGPIATLADARRHAEATLERFSELLGRGASTFVETTGVRAGRVFVFVYDQQFRGLDVVGGRADVRIHDNGVLSMFGSRAVDVPAGFDRTPRIDGDNARDRAHLHLRLAQRDPFAAPAPRSELAIWADVEAATPTAPRLAWRVPIDHRAGGERPVVGKVFVDARTGQIIEFVDEVYTCAFGHEHVRGEGCSHDHGSVDAPRYELEYGESRELVDITGTVLAWVQLGTPTDALSLVPLHNVRVDSSVGNAFTDSNGDFTIPFGGTNTVNLTVTLDNGRHMTGGLTDTAGNEVSVTVPATPGTPVTITILNATAPDTRWCQTATYWHVNDANLWLRSLVGNTGQMNNISAISAVVNIDNNCNAFYTNNRINFYTAGGGCNNTGFNSVIYHEWGHGLDAVWGGISQTDGLSEGWGDIVSNYRLDDPIVGRGFRTDGSGIRDARNNLRYPAGGGVHTQGQTWMGFAWGVREGLKQTLGNAAGVARAEAIVVASIVADATNQPDAVREVFILDDNDGNLDNGTPNYGVLSAEAQRRNLPHPPIRVATISHTAVGNTTDQLKPRLVSADVVAISGSIANVTLFYDAGAGTQQQPMVQSGTPDEYLGLLPGRLAPASIDYHIVARHSSGVDIRFPTQGELSATVNSFVEHYFENFDGAGDAGWTHGQTRRQDDWQRLTPAGRSGTSNGVPWADPGSAFSGTRAWGNDLGPSGWNGAYQPDVTNFLRSPLLNLSNAQNVRLQFRRWLTVEEAQFDQAQVRVNGATVWQNPTSGHTLDTGWVLMDIPVPQADNNPAVQLEWRLNTDGGLNLGGWNIDDVRLLSPVTLPPPDVAYTLTPPQVGLGQTTALSMQGAASAPGAILVSSSPGPTNLPGVPTLHVGQPFFAINFSFDAGGNFAINWTVPNDANVAGALFYTQVVQVDGAQLKVSNKNLILLGP